MADLNDLQREWDSQPEFSEEKMNEIAELVRTRSGSMRSRLRARDMVETVAGVFVIVVFGVFWFTAPNAIAKTGIAITIAGAAEVIVLMQLVQRRGRVDFASLPLKEFLLSEVQLLNRQISLLRQVAWWYLLPLYTGACVFVIGISVHGGWDRTATFCITFCAGYFVFCVFVWWLNQHARRATLEPLRDAMQRTYDGLAAMDSESAGADRDLLKVLANPALEANCRYVRFVRPSWHQIVLVILACLGGFCAGLLVQYHFVGPMRLEQWPLVGLMIGAVLGLGVSCVRRIRSGK